MSDLQDVLSSLSQVQREAVHWGDGAALVLAGPGAGKTRVLTARIAKILDASRDRHFRVLALTFTNKAAAEMHDRVDLLVPGLADRSFIGTFHAYCTQLLRQHGSHLGINPDFAIFDQDADRAALLEDALADAASRGEECTPEDVRWLRVIDQLKARLVLPDLATSQFRDGRTGQAVAQTYRIYESALLKNNALDYNGLVLGACRLMRDIVGVAERTRRTYAYWLIDEFQDTSPAQYRFLQLAGGGVFPNVFAVADDDQIIYQWAGASYRQLEMFRADFKPELIQLVENHRCPSDIVAAANKLVAHNTSRTPEKRPIVATKPSQLPTIKVVSFGSDRDEADGIATDIEGRPTESHGSVAVLGRTRAVLEPVLESLRKRGVRANLSQRRDRFISPQFAWLQACLEQAIRPTDQRLFTVLVDSANRTTGEDLDWKILSAEAQAAGVTPMEQWAIACSSSENHLSMSLGALALSLTRSRSSWRNVVKEAIPLLVASVSSDDGMVSDASDDRAAWDICEREIRSELGEQPDLEQLLQGMALRSKEPPRDPTAITLMTIHQAKGLEFDFVYVVGLAEGVMPSWQSLKKGDVSAEMEEERRNCFVAITRTREQLILSRAASYRGYRKNASRFLHEMGLIA